VSFLFQKHSFSLFLVTQQYETFSLCLVTQQYETFSLCLVTQQYETNTMNNKKKRTLHHIGFAVYEVPPNMPRLTPQYVLDHVSTYMLLNLPAIPTEETVLYFIPILYNSWCSTSSSGGQKRVNFLLQSLRFITKKNSLYMYSIHRSIFLLPILVTLVFLRHKCVHLISLLSLWKSWCERDKKNWSADVRFLMDFSLFKKERSALQTAA
jgi:hypothetical protein